MRVGKKYRLSKKIGGGSFGDIFLGAAPALDGHHSVAGVCSGATASQWWLRRGRADGDVADLLTCRGWKGLDLCREPQAACALPRPSTVRGWWRAYCGATAPHGWAA